MNSMAYKGYIARIDYDDEDGIFFGRVAGMADGVNFHGETVAELRASFHEAVDDYLAICAKVGKLPQKPYSGNLMLRVGAEAHARAAMAAEVSGKSLNQWGEEALLHAARIVLGEAQPKPS